MGVQKRERKRPEAQHFEAAIEQVQSWYPAASFGRGDQIPDDLPRELKDMITAHSFRMARHTCDEIAKYARMLADLPPDEDEEE